MVVLPSDKVLGYGQEREEQQPLKTLYLLHGLLGNCSDWTTNTNIRRLAEDRNIAVVMPSGENSFYVDQPIPNNDFGEYVGRELVDVTRRMFRLSDKREDTFIAGLSMGGFGAIRNGLVHHETFGYIAALSTAVQIFESPADSFNRTIFSEDAVFGDLEEASRTDKNPRIAFQKMEKALKGDASRYPKLYMACSEEDGLMPANRDLRDYLKHGSMDVTWRQGPGGHHWDFWREQIAQVLDWLPLDDAVAGISSGNTRL